MKERPIIFSGEMVRTILENRKSQTRRIIKPQPDFVADNVPSVHTDEDQKLGRLGKVIKCPYGNPGDMLWVRETFRRYSNHTSDSVKYKADGNYFGDEKWKPSIHMPRWASRIMLETVDIRVERLQDISEEDAESEGIDFLRHAPDADETLTAKKLFKILWSVINGDESWNLNPWVWVVEFKRSA